MPDSSRSIVVVHERHGWRQGGRNNRILSNIIGKLFLINCVITGSGESFEDGGGCSANTWDESKERWSHALDGAHGSSFLSFVSPGFSRSTGLVVFLRHEMLLVNIDGRG